MKIEEIIANESLRQHEFPVTRHRVYWAHAGVAPFPRCVLEAMQQYLEACRRGDQESVVEEHTVLKTRQAAARLLGCTPQEIALVGPTSVALSLVANGLDWQPGDNVVFYPDDYPSNVYPWLALAGRGVELRPVRPPSLGRIGVREIEPLVDRRTRLVALASVNFLSGCRLDVDAIGRFLRERDVLFSLDAIQSLGAMPTPLAHVDFAAADAHKWLLGPLAIGLFYVRREVQDRLRPTLLGWNNVSCPNYIAQEGVHFPPHAGRYEAGSMSLISIIGLRAALEMLNTVGVERIGERLLTFGERVIAAMESAGFRYLGERDPAPRSGILSFEQPGTDLAAVHARLLSRGIVTTLRKRRDGTTLLRLSPHFYNTESELDHLLGAL